MSLRPQACYNKRTYRHRLTRCRGMIGRLLVSLVFGFVLGTTGLLIAPNLAWVASPTLCDGELRPERDAGPMRYSCIARNGQINPLAPEQVVLHTVLVLAAVALFPVSWLFSRAEARGRERRRSMGVDLEVARPARAEVMQVLAVGNFKRQILMRAAELQLTLWVTPSAMRPYEAVVVWFVEQEQLGRLAEGSILPVRVNPAHPERIYPAEPWAQLVRWREEER